MKLLDERSKLQFRADNRSMAGKYTCIADNGIAEPASASIDLRIQCKLFEKITSINNLNILPFIKPKEDNHFLSSFQDIFS